MGMYWTVVHKNNGAGCDIEEMYVQGSSEPDKAKQVIEDTLKGQEVVFLVEGRVADKVHLFSGEISRRRILSQPPNGQVEWLDPYQM